MGSRQIRKTGNGHGRMRAMGAWFGSLREARKDPPSWWLSLAANRPVLTYGVLPLLFGIAIRAVVWVIGIPLEWPAGEITFAVALGAACYVLPPAITVLTLMRHIRLLTKGIGTQPTLSGKAIVSAFLRDQLGIMNDTITVLRREGRVMNAAERLQWIGRCFQTFSGQYIGVESNVPSAFSRLYSGYLEAHETYLRRTKRDDSERILLAGLNELVKDRTVDSQANFNFFQWHAANAVTLRHSDRIGATSLARQLGLIVDEHSVTDVALWDGEAAIVFMSFETSSDTGFVSVETPGPVKLVMALPGEPLYQKCSDYVHTMSKQSPVLTQEVHSIPKAFVEKWHLYAEPKERIRNSIPFLTGIATRVAQRTGTRADDLLLIDAGAGLGIEVTELTRMGYRVTLNEIDPYFRDCAVAYGTSRGVSIAPTRVTKEDWLSFGRSFGVGAFHLLWVIGNSLCLLPEPGDVEDALEQFYEVVVPGGAVVVDERNFQYIVSNWDEGDRIGENPCENFRYSGDVVYCGSLVRGVPIELIDRDGHGRKVVFEFMSYEGPDPRPLARISLLAFSQGQICNLLQARGFTDIEVYSNFKEGHNPDADFFTYVAWKPKS